MTITTEISDVLYDGDAGTLSFPYPFKVIDEAHLYVTIDGVNILQADATYPWAPTDIGVDGGGNVVFSSTPPPAGTANVLIYRDVPSTQETDYTPYDDFPADSHEAALDKLTMLIQEIESTLGRAVVVNVSDTSGADFTLPTPVAGAIMGVWNDIGSELVIGPTAVDIANAQSYAALAAGSASDANDYKDAADVSADEALTSANNAAVTEAALQGLDSLTYNAITAFDFDGAQTLYMSATGNLTTLTTANRSSGKSFTLIITAFATDVDITYNASWVKIGALPTTIPSGKTLMLSFVCVDTAETDVFVTGGLEI